MPTPMELQHASDDFERFLAEARDISGLTTRNQTYTMVQGTVSAPRLTPRQCLSRRPGAAACRCLKPAWRTDAVEGASGPGLRPARWQGSP